MAVFRCKMCGGAIEFTNGDSVGVCDSCGTKQTLPRIDNEKREKLYGRANHFRRGNEYDKAMALYEQILNEDSSDAEAYWSIVLCRYGIDYVEDPSTNKRVPTVNRTQYTSIYTDKDYQAAIQYADTLQKEIYIAEAAEIDRIQKEILTVSNQEKPFDIFICYKEKDAAGERTLDSVYAQEIYQAFTDEGYRVFFSRVTLEDKLGTAYEPYIFAALHSSPVMIAVCTSKDYINAPWVKNEWSRYLSLIKAGEKKTLVPVYRDMDPYDLPEEFAFLQGQDAGKVGYMQDLVRGVKKILGTKETKSKNNAETSKQDRLNQNALTFLSLGDYMSAEKNYKSLTANYPEDHRGWWGLILCRTKKFTVSVDAVEQINQWFLYVEKLCSKERFKDLEEKYLNYLKQISYQKAKKQMIHTTKLMSDFKAKSVSLENESNYIYQNIVSLRQQLSQSVSESDAGIKVLEKAVGKKEALLKIPIFAIIFGIIAIVIAFGFLASDKKNFSDGVTAFLVVLLLAGIASLAIGISAKRQGRYYNNSLSTAINELNNALQNRQWLINSYEENIGHMESQFNVNQSRQEECRRTINACNLYLQQGEKRIVDAEFANCKKAIHR